MDKLHPVLWIVITAISGAGKDKPISFTSTALNSVGLTEMSARALTSDASVDKHFIECNVLVYSLDEAGAKAATARGSKGEAHSGSVMDTIMEMYTKTNDGWQTKSYSRGAGSAGDVYAITRPCLPVMMASTPTLMMDQLNGGLLSGQGNRILFIPCATSNPVTTVAWQDFREKKKELTLSVIEGILGGPVAPETSPLASLTNQGPVEKFRMACLRKGIKQGEEDWQSDGHMVQVDTSSVMSEMDPVLLDWQSLAKGQNPNILYNRFRENTYRVATILQRARTLLADPHNLVMDRQDVEDAMCLIKMSCDMLNTATIEFEHEDEVRQIGNEMVTTLREKHNGTMTYSGFKKLKRSQGEKQVRAIKMLLATGEIELAKDIDGIPYRVYLEGNQPEQAAA